VVAVGGVLGWGLVVYRVFYNVVVGVVNGGNRGGGHCLCNRSAELVGVCCPLGGTVMACHRPWHYGWKHSSLNVAIC
jgi:hypothetical protein